MLISSNDSSEWEEINWWEEVGACKFNKQKNERNSKMDKSQENKKVEDWFRIQKNHERGNIEWLKRWKIFRNENEKRNFLVFKSFSDLRFKNV